MSPDAAKPEGTDVVTKFWFEIVKLQFGEFAWLLVGFGGDDPCVLARSDCGFSSEKRARKAVRGLKEVIGGAEFLDDTLRTFQDVVVHAEIIDAIGDDDECDIPASTFTFAPDADPLMIPQSSSHSTGGDGWQRGHRRRGTHGHEAAHLVTEDAAAPADVSTAHVRSAALPDSGTPTKTAARDTPRKTAARGTPRKTPARSKTTAKGASGARASRGGTAKKAGGRGSPRGGTGTR